MKRVLMVLALVLAASAVREAVSQEAKSALQPAPGEEAVLGSLVDGRPGGRDGFKLTSLRDGKIPVLGGSKVETEDNRRLLAMAARWYVYRFTHPIFHGQDKETMNDLMKEISRALLLDPPTIRRNGLNTNQEIYLQELAKEMIPCCREVLKKNSKPIVRVNTVRTLAALAETGPYPGQEELADTLVEIINNPEEIDAVKLYALRGLKELFAQGTPEHSIIKDEKRESRAILALHQFLARPSSLSADAPEDEVDGYRYVRREALRALGQTRYPTLPKAKEGEGRTALVLLRYLRNDGITPPSSLSEQLEAAIGVCQLRPGLDKDYNPDYAASHVGHFIVNFANQHTRGAFMPWKVASARLGIALEQFKANAAANAPAKAAEFVGQVVDRSREVLKPIEADRQEVNPLALDNWIRSATPPSGSVYRTLKDSVIKPGD